MPEVEPILPIDSKVGMSTKKMQTRKCQVGCVQVDNFFYGLKKIKCVQCKRPLINKIYDNYSKPTDG